MEAVPICFAATVRAMPRQIESRTLGPWHPDGHLNEIDDRLVRRWATGERSIPNWVFAALAEIVDVRAGKLNAFLIRLRKEANAPAIAVQALGDLIRASNRSNVQRSKDRAIELIGQISPLGDDGGPASRAARGTMDALMKLFNSIPDGNVEKCKQDALAAVDALKSKFQNATIKASAPDEPGGQPMSAPSDLDRSRRTSEPTLVAWRNGSVRHSARRISRCSGPS
jgi:hypothetical protein